MDSTLTWRRLTDVRINHFIIWLLCPSIASSSFFMLVVLETCATFTKSLSLCAFIELADHIPKLAVG